ncbi:MAG TPA: BPSS1780 family membrane protein [Oxalicibacterium sp.]|uniref:BPSS1780 family membrane protein n=1 Tax=Oxalicibacterium sp. TaxID=2766525 RepID=UPI002B588055|nr:BPSS1780 family membrane protein [Oxalicibacterium sp.]HWU98840.1 BPSS1780 family membrane protein [Oxalicibacterium sp.]
MDKLPAKTGLLWVKEGFEIFSKRPAELTTLFFGYLFLMLLVGIVPVIGQLMPLVLVPLFSMTFMHACVHVKQNKRVYPNLLLTGFRSPAVRTLIKLGMLYLLAAIIAIGASSLIDGGVFFQAITGQIAIDADIVRESNMTMAMLFAAMLYTPAAMAFWYAAPLIGWQGMGVGKAIFYSFFAVRRAGKAFLVYGFAWINIGIVLPVIASSLVGALLNSPSASVFIMLPMSMVLTVIMYCSFYPTYTQMFGEPPEPLPS